MSRDSIFADLPEMRRVASQRATQHREGCEATRSYGLFGCEERKAATDDAAAAFRDAECRHPCDCQIFLPGKTEPWP